MLSLAPYKISVHHSLVLFGIVCLYFVPILSIHLLVHTARREDEQPATYGAAKVTN